MYIVGKEEKNIHNLSKWIEYLEKRNSDTWILSETKRKTKEKNKTHEQNKNTSN